MTEKKYESHIITDFKPGLELPEFRGKTRRPLRKVTFHNGAGDKVIKGSPYMEAVWLCR